MMKKYICLYMLLQLSIVTINAKGKDPARRLC